MADEIMQVLGFDASQALTELQKLDQSLSGIQGRFQGVQQTLGAFNDRAGKTVAALKQITSNADAAFKALSKLGNVQTNPTANASQGTSASTTFNTTATAGAQKAQQAQAALIQGMAGVQQAATNNLGAATQQVQKLTISWETLTRVVATQLIVRAMSQLRDAFREAVDEAIAFQKQASLIRTISPEVGVEQIKDSVRELSDSFNIPLLETASGLYQTLSNQVGDFATSVRFAGEAAKFSKATNSSLSDSVDLLSGAIRSYGLEADDAGRVAGIFFTAIDKGRITADQLANAFGRVGPAAKNVGISLEELSAAAATISDKGVGTAETLTQFRGIITALTKPTDAMKEKLREMGFASVETAIATLRLDGVLDALAKSTDGSSQAFAKLFPNVRGIGGALSLTGDNLRTYAENIRLATANGEDFANSKFGIAVANDGEQVTKAMNQIKNAIVVDFGQSVVALTKNLLDFVGGSDAVVTAIKDLTPLVIAMTGAFTAGAIGLGAFKIAALALAGPVGIASAALAALLLSAQAISNHFQRQAIELRLVDVNATKEEAAQALEETRKAGQSRLQEEERTNQKIVQASLKRITEINKHYLQDVANAKSANSSLVENTERSLNKIVQVRERFLHAIQEAIGRSQEQIRQSQSNVSDLQGRREDLNFEVKTKGFDDAGKAFALMQRAANLSNQARAAMVQAFQKGDEQSQKQAENIFQRAEAAANEARSVAQRTGDYALEARAIQGIDQLLQTRIGTEQELIALQQDRQAKLREEAQAQEKVVEELRKQRQVVLDNTGVFDKGGQLFDEDEQLKRAAKREAALKKIQELAFSGNDFGKAQGLGLDKFIETFQNDLSARPIELIFNVKKSVADVEASLKQSLGSLDVELPFLKDLEEAIGRPLRQFPEQIAQAVTEAKAQLDSIGQTENSRNLLNTEIGGQEKVRQAALQALDKGQGNRDALAQQSQSADTANQALESAQQKLADLIATGTATQADVEALARQLAGITFPEQFRPDAAAFGEALTATAKIVELQGKLKALPEVDQAKADALQGVLQKMEESTADEKSQKLSTNLGTAATNGGTLASSAVTTADAYERALAAANSLSAVPAPAVPAVATAQFGRRQYLAAGGHARGQDQIPAMLAAGETVVDARNSRKFFPQIQAMRAGIQPIFRQDGGQVTNIGDININVNGSDARNVSPRALAEGLRRELRRRTSL